jgi:hypothetical protein
MGRFSSSIPVQMSGIFSLLLAAAVIAQAQTPASQARQSRESATEVTIRGCLQPGAERTTLTDQTGTTYLLRNAPTPNPGRRFVEIRGEELAPTAQSGQAALPEIRVNSLRKLSDLCPQKITPPPANSEPPTGSAESPATPPYQSPIAPQTQEAAPVLNQQGAGGAPSPGTGNPPKRQ